MLKRIEKWFIDLMIKWTIPCPDCKHKFCTCLEDYAAEGDCCKDIECVCEEKKE